MHTQWVSVGREWTLGGGGSGECVSHTVLRMGVVYVCGRHRYAYTGSYNLVHTFFSISSLCIIYTSTGLAWYAQSLER